MPQIEMLDESEAGSSWQFRLQVLDDEGTLRAHRLTLAWADYDHWAPGGDCSPAAVAAAVVDFLLQRSGASNLRSSIDASLARREYPDADEVIPTLIGR
ncbi:MAG: hypothetical protein ACYTGR_07085 [Planctomycetota bacterium]|jgi:hypothetical protein